MHKSLADYSEALECTVGQVRRYIRAGLVPSAELVKGHMGRPGWIIRDTSPKAIQDLNKELTLLNCRLKIPHFNIEQAGERLAHFHRTQGMEITYQTLARMMGMSKSSLYRTYGRGAIGKTLRSARKKVLDNSANRRNTART